MRGNNSPLSLFLKLCLQKMIIKENSTFKLVQTMTDQILLVMKGIYSEPVLRVWHISQKEAAMNELRRIS